MNKKLFVANIPYGATDEDLLKYFSKAGEVEEAKVIRYRDTGKSRGFAFVTMKTESGAKKAQVQLHNQPLKIGDIERNILVNEAKEMKKR